MEKNKKYCMYIGRFSPFHKGHDYIIKQALNQGKSICVAIRDTPITGWDPYTKEERMKMIQEHYKGRDVQVIIIPDIESVNIGRKVGYEVIRYDAPKHIEGISATQIRKMIQDGNNKWKEEVPKTIADFLISKENVEQKSNGLVIWFTGLSGAGKSTLGNRLEGYLISKGKNVKMLDGDEVRQNLTSDLGFSKKDRSENIKRISYVAKSIADCNGIAIVAVISPYEEDRQKAKILIGKDRFFEIYVKCNIDILKSRDVKGLYKKAIAGEIENFTGISDPYEEPLFSTCVIDTGMIGEYKSLELVLEKLRSKIKGL